LTRSRTTGWKLVDEAVFGGSGGNGFIIPS
jgi:hypothetical protein